MKLKRICLLSAPAILVGACHPAIPRHTRPQPLPARPPSASALPAASEDIVLDFVGDCTFGSVNGDSGPARFPAVFRDSGLADYPFHRVRRWLADDDLTIANFECTLTDATKTADKQWHFKGPARYADIFPAGSVEVAGIANNHAHDYLQAGFDDTAANLRKAGVPAFYQSHPYVTTIKGVEVVIIGDCTVVGENTTVIGDAPGRVLGQIIRYKKPDNIVVVFLHWGSELDKTPRPWQQALGRRFIRAGADAVIGAHPHVVQGIEKYMGRYIVYSLGNFAFGGNTRSRHPETLILRLMRYGAGRPLSATVIPCLTTSSGSVINNYQPTTAHGAQAQQIIDEIRVRSRSLTYGIKTLDIAPG